MSVSMDKSSLVAHLSDWHGTSRNVTAPGELARWSKQELEVEHTRLLGKGPCSPANHLTDEQEHQFRKFFAEGAPMQSVDEFDLLEMREFHPVLATLTTDKLEVLKQQFLNKERCYRHAEPTTVAGWCDSCLESRDDD